jgi:hypothetical protein
MKQKEAQDKKIKDLELYMKQRPKNSAATVCNSPPLEKHSHSQSSAFG